MQDKTATPVNMLNTENFSRCLSMYDITSEMFSTGNNIRTNTAIMY
jgi:hypothetical protein